jgi:glycosyltransferase involved in cell wall biosynthesis
MNDLFTKFKFDNGAIIGEDCFGESFYLTKNEYEIYLKNRNMVSVVITSYNRIDLLKRTISTFNRINTYPISKFIIVDDSDNTEMHKELRKLYPNYIILTEGHKGLVESIDKAYSLIDTPYVFHSEDDYEFYRPDFIQRLLAVLENDKSIMQIWIRAMNDVTGQPILPELCYVDDVSYYIMGEHQEWYGFCFQCGLRSMDAYKKVSPYTQHSPVTDFLSQRECKIGIAYHKLGYKAAILPEGYAIHTGFGRSTCGNKNK